MPDIPSSPLLWRIAVLLFEALAAIILLIDALARPLYRPLVDWVASFRFIERMEQAIAPLPRLVILILFGVPFAIAEPLKLVALVIIAHGHIIFGVVVLILAYLATFLIVERIYHAGRDKLLTYRWFAWFMAHVIHVRNMLGAFRRRVMARFTFLK